LLLFPQGPLRQIVFAQPLMNDGKVMPCLGPRLGSQAVQQRFFGFSPLAVAGEHDTQFIGGFVMVGMNCQGRLLEDNRPGRVQLRQRSGILR